MIICPFGRGKDPHFLLRKREYHFQKIKIYHYIIYIYRERERVEGAAQHLSRLKLMHQKVLRLVVLL